MSDLHVSGKYFCWLKAGASISWWCLISLGFNSTALGAENTVSDKDVIENTACERPAREITLSASRLCVVGIEDRVVDSDLEQDVEVRRPQWRKWDVMRRDDALSRAWPPTVYAIELIQGGLRKPSTPLKESSIPGLREEQFGLVYYYPRDLSFRGENIRFTCSETIYPQSPEEYAESCRISIPFPNRLRLRIRTYAGEFGDAGDWPTVLRSYDPAAWQEALDSVDAFLDLAIIYHEAP